MSLLKDSDRVYRGIAKQGICDSVEFDCVVMSISKYQELTND